MLQKSFLVLVAGIALFSCDRQRKTNVEAPFNYDLTGKGDTTLVFAHGLAINKSYWDEQIDSFKDKYTILTFDLPGHGSSNIKRSKWDIHDYADDIVGLSKSLHLNKIILIGHSMSGNVNLLAYEKLKDQVVGFIGVDNFQQLGEPMSADKKKEMDSLVNDFRAHYKRNAAEYVKSLFSPMTDSVVRKRVTDDFVNSDSLMVTQLLSTIVDNSQYEKSQLKGLTVPLILIDSDMFPINETSLEENCGAGVKTWIIQGTGHFPMIERPAEFNSALAEALDYIRASKK
jgi:pimeloyl-ACP methyl ester carboxylesterase